MGEALFQRILASHSGAIISTHAEGDVLRFILHGDGRIHLAIPELLSELRALAAERESAEQVERFPLVLIAGERRAYNANLIYRDPAWRKTDAEGALQIHPDDARQLGLSDGGAAICASPRGSLPVQVQITDAVRPGLVTLPNGYGSEHRGADGRRRAAGPAINLLTDAAWRDPISFTPLHKYVRVRLRAA